MGKKSITFIVVPQLRIVNGKKMLKTLKYYMYLKIVTCLYIHIKTGHSFSNRMAQLAIPASKTAGMWHSICY